KFQQNAKYDEISERKTRVIYLCSADNKRLAACAFGHKLSAFLSLMLPRRGTFRTEERGGIVPPQLPSAAQRCNTLDFASKVVCHETPARFLWILPVMILLAYFLPRCPLWSRRHDRLLAGRPGPAG